MQKIEELKLSLSKVKLFDSCLAKYKYSYIEKLPKKDWEHHLFGKFLHKVLEDFHNEYINGSKEPFGKIMTNVYKIALLEYGPKLAQEAKKEAYEIIKKYLKIINENKKLVFNVLAVEKAFNFEIDEKVILNGMIDRIQMDDDNVLCVADYKTTKNKKYLKDDFFQLLTYAYVICREDTSIKKVRGSYILLRHDFEYITKEFEIDEILQVNEKYKEYAKKIKSQSDWKPNPTPLCAYCDYMDICEAGSKLLKKDIIKTGKVKW